MVRALLLAALLAPAARAAEAPSFTIEVRLPSWEIAAVQSALVFSGEPMRLTDPERLSAAFLFQEAVDLDAVRVVAVALSTTKTPQTWGNVIRVPAGMTLTRRDLIHELVHVWQYQTRGAGYLSNSLLAQACAVASTGSRDAAYAYALEDGKTLAAYGAEQQAMIIEDYYAYPAARKNPRYELLVAELRRTKTVKQGQAVVAEAAAGLPPRAKELPLPAGLGPLPNVAPGPGVYPQLEIRFSTPW